MAISEYMQTVGQQARAASAQVCRASTQLKNDALMAIGDAILARRKELMQANEKDLEAGRNNGLSDPLLDRLTFTEARFESMVEGLQQVAALEDPVGEISDMSYQPNGLQIGRMRTPLGVIGIIYESRPNVTIDAASLCLKSGNAAILRGGSEAIHSNLGLADAIRRRTVDCEMSYVGMRHEGAAAFAASAFDCIHHYQHIYSILVSQTPRNSDL